ncbi:MAG: ribbon-helix-helix domain-containing protein [Actinobacteria bacterium]|nr:ribbon-helix-helix domain-containing protein [Actinomycetota bacterium]
MKTAISIPDDLFEDAERLARTQKKSRSRLYGDAVREYVARHSADQVTGALNEVLEGVTLGEADFVARGARTTLERSDW